jgi:hypothetical protein
MLFVVTNVLGALLGCMAAFCNRWLLVASMMFHIFCGLWSAAL